MTWIENVKTLMKERNFNQKQVAEMAGLTESTFSRYMSGIRAPGVDNMARIAKALGVTVDHLLNNKTKVYYVLEDWCYDGDCTESPRVTLFSDETKCHNYFAMKVREAQDDMDLFENSDVDEEYNNLLYDKGDDGFYLVYNKYTGFLYDHIEVRFGVQEV